MGSQRFQRNTGNVVAVHELLKADAVDLDYLVRYTNAHVLVICEPDAPDDGLLLRDGEGHVLAWDRQRNAAVDAMAANITPALTDERLVSKLRYKGIDKFIAYEVDLTAVRDRYADSFDNISRDLGEVEDMRVLDFNGHQIMANFSLDALGDPIKFG